MGKEREEVGVVCQASRKEVKIKKSKVKNTKAVLFFRAVTDFNAGFDLRVFKFLLLTFDLFYSTL